MKHTKPIGKSRPMVAGSTDLFCQIAVVLGGILGLPVPKELVNKCLGIE